MNEAQARVRLQEILQRLYDSHPQLSEDNLIGADGKQGFIEYHIHHMYIEFGGSWNDDKAAEYVQSVHLDTMG